MQISQNEMRIQSWRISSFGLCMTCTTCNSANRVCWYINIIIWYSSSTIVLSVINIRADNNFQSIHDFCPFCNIKCLFTGSVCTVWLGADRRKPQGTGETQTPILGHLIRDVSDWLVGVAKYLSVVGCTCQVCTFRWCKPTKDNQYAWFLHGIPVSACSPLGYAVQVNWPTLMVAAVLTELVHGSIWLCKIATFYSMYGLPWKLLAPLHNITTKNRQFMSHNTSIVIL